MWEYELREEWMKKENKIGKYDQNAINESVRKFAEEHPEERREQVRKAAEVYRKKNANNEDYLTMRRTSQAAYQRRKYAEAKAEAEADPDKMDALRAKRAKKMREYRARLAAKKQGN